LLGWCAGFKGFLAMTTSGGTSTADEISGKLGTQNVLGAGALVGDVVQHGGLWGCILKRHLGGDR
jgi:hypothetical protein